MSLTFSKYDASGVSISFTKSRQIIEVSGWFDHFVGIEGGKMPLGDFLRGLGITEAMCRKALAAGVAERGKE